MEYFKNYFYWETIENMKNILTNLAVGSLIRIKISYYEGDFVETF